ncbi:sugar transporter ERD6-like 16 [Aristolochia californica]|uniref:sugar transporter ERD6-like 16 n=1 Tax=Aristolochia californica TaxID=171875 RepID=UPI0035E214CA
MAIPRDVENGGRRGKGDEIKEPLIKCQQKGFVSAVCEEDRIHGSSGGDEGSIWMVLLSTLVAVCGSYEFGCCVGYSAPTQSDIRKNLDLSLAEYSVFGSIVTIGAMIGAITSGEIADWIGRKRAMAMSAGVCIVGWLALSLSKGAVFLDIGRFCTGYGIGVFSYVVPVFIAEITPKNRRGGLATIHQVLITSGISVTFIIGTVMPWRLLAITGIIPCVILLCGIGFIPESPRWLAKIGRHKQFEEALRRLRGNDADIYQEAAEIQDYIENLKTLPKARVQDLFQGRYTRSLIVGVGLMLFQQFSGINGVLFYASETFISAGFSSGKIGTMATGCIQVPVTILGALLMDKSGRRALLMASASGSCMGCLFTGLSLYLKADGLSQGWVPILALVGILLYLGSFSLGMAAIPWVMMSEIFPINMKGIAGSFVTMISWLGSWALSFTFNFLMKWSPPGTFFLFAGFCALTVVFVALIVPETKGRTLEEIQADLNS